MRDDYYNYYIRETTNERRKERNYWHLSHLSMFAKSSFSSDLPSRSQSAVMTKRLSGFGLSGVHFFSFFLPPQSQKKVSFARITFRERKPRYLFTFIRKLLCKASPLQMPLVQVHDFHEREVKKSSITSRNNDSCRVSCSDVCLCLNLQSRG